MTPDAILIPGGGLTPSQEPAPWVIPRLDAALAMPGDPLLIALSAGTTHKPRGPVTESDAAAAYLLRRGASAHRILTDPWSLDTIGNAYFARVMHCAPRGLARLHVITSEFHMDRTRAVFDWVFQLPLGEPFLLTYQSTPNTGLAPEVLAARVAKEQASLAELSRTVASIRTLPQLHEFLFTRHRAYVAGGAPGPAASEWAASY